MKKIAAAALALLLIVFSALPVFAESIDSPDATKTNYIIHIPTDIDGGTASFEYVTDVGDDGTQTVIIRGVPDDGFDLTGWDIVGDYTPVTDLTQSEIKLIISGDIDVKPVFTKKGAPATTSPVPSPTKVVDNGSKSPKTGSGDGIFWVLFLGSAAALAAVVTIAKRRSVNK